MGASVRGPHETAGEDDTRARSRVWAITSYFPFDDPPDIKRRLRVFREFRRHLQIPLAAIELSLGGQFDLTADDAEILVQVADGDLMWQKERLLNRVIELLPAHCDTVAWLDCDVVLLRADWAEQGRERLGTCVLLQPFSRLYYLTTDVLSGDSATPPHARCVDSLAHRYCQGDLPDEVFLTRGASQRLKYTPGIVWMAARELVQRHGLYDAAIVGEGDKLIFSTACGHGDDFAALLKMRQAFRDHFAAWAGPFSAAVAGRIGCLEGEAYHLWHGDLQNRHYIARYEGFDAFEFDPRTDVARTAGGAWRWNSDKPELHDFVRRVFERRRQGPATPAERLAALVAALPRDSSTGV